MWEKIKKICVNYSPLEEFESPKELFRAFWKHLCLHHMPHKNVNRQSSSLKCYYIFPKRNMCEISAKYPSSVSVPFFPHAQFYDRARWCGIKTFQFEYWLFFYICNPIFVLEIFSHRNKNNCDIAFVAGQMLQNT